MVFTSSGSISRAFKDNATHKIGDEDAVLLSGLLAIVQSCPREVQALLPVSRQGLQDAMDKTVLRYGGCRAGAPNAAVRMAGRSGRQAVIAYTIADVLSMFMFWDVVVDTLDKYLVAMTAASRQTAYSQEVCRCRPTS